VKKLARIVSKGEEDSLREKPSTEGGKDSKPEGILASLSHTLSIAKLERGLGEVLRRR
jgi:hypothetical protein